MSPRSDVILVVDDDDQLRHAIGEALAEYGWRVMPVRTGGDGLVELISAPNFPAAVLLDLNTPGLDGRGFLRARALNPRLAEIPVIVITGVREDLPDVPNGSVLFKPFELGDLVRKVQQHVA